MNIKRMKLNYDEISTCSRPASRQWDKLLGSGGSSVSSGGQSTDWTLLAKAVQDGVPKPRRGSVWRLLVDAGNSNRALLPPWSGRSDYGLYRQSVDYDRLPLLNVAYEEVLRQLTSHQHLIIIDLGRTFPTHPYYAASLGPGQLSLYNLLKAYSLLDNQVGYCQGLSFIGAVLLLHLDEEEAYYMLRHLMLELGLRHQYLPDMAALQVQLYQMARLLRDTHRDLYEHLEQNEVTPSLYAAPWFLTLFASQFPLGFVVRVFGTCKTTFIHNISREPCY